MQYARIGRIGCNVRGGRGEKGVREEERGREGGVNRAIASSLRTASTPVRLRSHRVHCDGGYCRPGGVMATCCCLHACSIVIALLLGRRRATRRDASVAAAAPPPSRKRVTRRDARILFRGEVVLLEISRGPLLGDFFFPAIFYRIRTRARARADVTTRAAFSRSLSPGSTCLCAFFCFSIFPRPPLPIPLPFPL